MYFRIIGTQNCHIFRILQNKNFKSYPIFFYSQLIFMKFTISLIITIVLFSLQSFGFTTTSKKTKLIVVISYDQMRADYLERFSPIFSQDGFRKLESQGSSSPLCFFNHVSNMTCPGHAIISTGCYPSKTGIITNDFFDSPSSCFCYCVEDKKSPVIGNEKQGRSPLLMKTPALGDYIKKKFKGSKIDAIALKDRAAILMAGQKPDNVVWFDWKSKGFTTSTYYKKPTWIQSINQSVPFNAYANQNWEAEIPSPFAVGDNSIYEESFPGGDITFPHTIPNIEDKNYAEAFLSSPYGIEYLFNASKFIIEQDKLGKDNKPDLLAIGVSTTDFVGHLFGPDSREVQELYVHCDRILADFIKYLDTTIGSDSYTIVITSDHGVSPIPEFAKNVGTMPLDAGRIDENQFVKSIDNYLNNTFKKLTVPSSWISIFEPPTLFIKDSAVYISGISKSEIADSISAFMQRQPGISHATSTDNVIAGMILPGWDKDLVQKFRNDIFPGRTGDIMFMVKPYWIWGSKAATHGTPYDYDTHVPLIFYGAGIPKNTVIKGSTDPADIFPTLCKILGISYDYIHGNPLDLTGKTSKDQQYQDLILKNPRIKNK
jgi:predicted AlkP superfamily pyrophosphatase or phosphodiesterase